MAAITSARTLGAEIRAARTSAGLTQQALADNAGVSRPTVVQLEGGHPTGELGKALAVITALGLQISLIPESKPVRSLDALFSETKPI